MKYLNFKRHNFSTVQKTFNMLINSLFKLFKNTIFNLKKVYKHLDINKFNIPKFGKYLELKRYNINNFKKISFIKSKFLFLQLIRKFGKYLELKRYNINNFKKISFIKSELLFLHLPASIIFFAFLYIAIPTFYNYEKLQITKTICNNNNIKCSIEGSVKYRFYPTPRLQIKGLKIEGFAQNKRNLISSEDASIKLSFKNLLAKEKHKFKKVVLHNFKAKLNLKNFKIYKDILSSKINSNPIIFKKGQISFYDEKNYVASIYDANIKGKFLDNNNNLKINGKFLNDDIFINLKSTNFDSKASTDLVIKMVNLNYFTKINFSDFDNDKKKIGGSFLIKKDKNKITGIFDLKDNELSIKKSNLRNSYIDGKLEGKIVFLPYFNFDLELNLNSINFTKLYNYFLSLDKTMKKKLFKINSKLNGKLNFSSDKLYTKHNLIKSFESRIKFYNGNLNLEQFLINLGKLGAADVLGTINSDKKFTNLKFESNIFVDNKKKFLSKFGAYKVKNLFSNLFISGNFDLDNPKLSIYEISESEKLKINDINYIETEFNDIMLEDGFLNLFNFLKFKTFIKSITSEIN